MSWTLFCWASGATPSSALSVRLALTRLPVPPGLALDPGDDELGLPLLRRVFCDMVSQTFSNQKETKKQFATEFCNMPYREEVQGLKQNLSFTRLRHKTPILLLSAVQL